MPVTGIRTKKAQALLSYLAVTGRKFSRPALAGLFWGEMPESNALMNLRKALTELRRHVPEHLTTSRQSISFNVNAPYWLDVRAFEAPIQKLKIASEYSRKDVSQLENAAGLYQGDFLDGFYVRNAPEFEEWMLMERVRLKDMALWLLGKLAAYYSEKGDYEPGIDYTKRILTLEPWLEEAHRGLMQLYAFNGQRSLALAQYEKCRQVLYEELAVEPGLDTEALYEKIRAGEFTPHDHLASAAQMPATRGYPPTPVEEEGKLRTNLPPQPLDIVGRERELADLEDKIYRQNARLISILGPGGIGKTRLALEFARQQLGETSDIEKDRALRFTDGVYFVPLAPLDAGDLIISAIAEAMNFRLDYGESQLFDYLESKRLLLILDNFEHLLSEVQLVTDILQSAPDVIVIVTSRERLRLHEEHVFPLSGLDYPQPASAGPRADFSAGRLFVQTAQRQQPEFNLKEQDVELVAHICQQVDGMPLALELAAAWTDSLPLTDISNEIKRSFDFLAVEYRNLPQRHRSLRAVIDISWDQLDPDEQKLFSELSIFQGGFTREAAEGITGAGFQDLSKLVGKSLLRYENSENRFYIHELLQQYGAEKLSQDQQAEEQLRDRHRQYFLQWLEDQFDPSIRKGRGQKALLGDMKIELENARAAWTWSLRDVDRGPTITRKQLSRIGKYFISRVGYLEGDRAFRNIADQLTGVDESSDVNSIVLKVGTIIWQAVFEAELGDRNAALQLLQESKDLLDSPQLAEMNLLEERAHYLVNYTRADLKQPYEVKLERLNQAAKMYREAEEPFGLAFALTNSALLAIVTGRLEQAGKLLEESVIVQEQSESLLGLAVSYTELGILSFVKNDYGDAKEWLRKSVDISYDLDNLHRVTAGSIYLGTVHIYSGEFNRAREILEKCVADSAELGIRPRHTTALNYLGYSELHLGNFQAATELGQAALDLARETDNKEMIAQTSMLFGATALARENFAEALDRFQEADEERTPRPFVEIVYGDDCGQIGLGAALLQLGHEEEAENIFNALWQRAGENRRLDQALQAIVGQALLSVERGQDKNARELYSLAAGQPFIGNSRWFLDAFGRYIHPEIRSKPAPSIDIPDEPSSFQYFWDTAEGLMKTE